METFLIPTHTNTLRVLCTWSFEIAPIMCTHLPSVPLFSSWYSHDDITPHVFGGSLIWSWLVDQSCLVDGNSNDRGSFGCRYDLYPSNVNALDNWVNFNSGMWLFLFVITVTCRFCILNKILLKISWLKVVIKGKIISTSGLTKGISASPIEDSISSQCACIRCTNCFSSTVIWDKVLNQHEFSVFCTGDS